jgi:hypothetical protein
MKGNRKGDPDRQRSRTEGEAGGAGQTAPTGDGEGALSLGPGGQEQAAIHRALRGAGFVYEYGVPDGEDWTEVWVSDKAKLAVRIEWLRVSKPSPIAEGR